MRFNDLPQNLKNKLIEKETINSLVYYDYSLPYEKLYQDISKLLFQTNPTINIRELEIMYPHNYEDITE